MFSLTKGFPIGSLEGQTVAKRNCESYDRLNKAIKIRCSVADCGYMLDPRDNAAHYGLPFIGDVCEVCFYMYQALQGPDLTDPKYFQKLHDKWKKDNDPDKIKKDRERLGL